MRKVAVVILNFNGQKYLDEFLPSVVEYSAPHPVVVIDNASTDDSVNWLQKNFSEVKTILLDKNLGFSGGYNEGLKKVDAEFVILLNSDIEVTPNWIDPVIDYMEKSPEVIACQPKIKDYKKKTHFEYAGASGGYIDVLGYPFCRGRLFQSLEEDQGQYDNPQEVFWASGACLFVRKNTYYEIGGLEEDFFAHMEEIDFCWRAWNHGYKVAVYPESTVYHVGGGTLEHAHPRKTYLNFRNGLSLLLKNESLFQLIWRLPVRIILDWVAALQFSVVSGPVHGWAILKAHFHFIGKTYYLFQKRKSTNPGKKIATRYQKSIIWKCYIQGVKKYKNL